MRVLQISKFYPPVFGGMEFFVLDLVGELSQKVQCDVLCANIGKKTLVEDGGCCNVIRCGSLGTVSSTSISPVLIRRLRQLSRQYDIMHVHLPNPMANLAYYLVRPDCWLVVHWHSDILRQRTLMRFYRPLQDWLLRRADVIVATSQPYLDGSAYLRSFKDKCTVIPLGLNPGRLKVRDEEIGRIKQQCGHRPIIFTLGRLVYYKGLSYLVNAARDVDACLLIGGGGPLRAKLAQQIARLSLAHKVFLLDDIRQEDLGAYYRACDVFCLPSIRKTEAFGLVQLEAMYFEKPVVSTDIAGSGVSWVNQSGVTGLVVPPENPAALAQALRRIIESRELAEEFGKNGGKRFAGEFNIGVVADKMLQVYESVLEDQKGV